METDGQYMLGNNYTYSKLLLNKALNNKIPFIYASSAAVYGTNNIFKEHPANERPINIYGYSKYLFDQYVRGMLDQAQSTLVGLRYFNVYGPHEAHKGRMASVTYQFLKQLNAAHTIKLFEGTDGSKDGEQKRDFIYVSDVVKVNLFFMNNTLAKGIFNVGTGTCGSFNQIADCLIQLEGRGTKEYIPFPEVLRNKYQSFTQADISNLRSAGYTAPFLPVEAGIKDYYPYLKQENLS
jgi:ADP-L-glycero-D-manno-heptose 6-epimerase